MNVPELVIPEFMSCLVVLEGQKVLEMPSTVLASVGVQKTFKSEVANKKLHCFLIILK